MLSRQLTKEDNHGIREYEPPRGSQDPGHPAAMGGAMKPLRSKPLQHRTQARAQKSCLLPNLIAELFSSRLLSRSHAVYNPQLPNGGAIKTSLTTYPSQNNPTLRKPYSQAGLEHQKITT